MASSWDQFPEVGAPQQRGGGIVLTDPYQARGDQRAEEDQEMQRQKLGVDTSNTGFIQRDKLRSDYNALPAVKEYRVAVQALAASLKRGADGSGDTALIYDYVKALDPTSVVREAEVGMAASGASTVEAAAAKLKKEFGIEGGGNLPPEIRNRLRREIITSVIPRVKQYNQFRGQFEELAKRNNFDPYEIVGKHDADPYVDVFREYDQRNKLGEYAPGQNREPIPGANRDNITFDIDTGTGAFGSQIEAPRLNPQQQGALDAFLKANAGNPNFGPDQLSAFYQSMGIQGGAMPADDTFFEAVRKGESFGTQPNYAAADEEAKRIAMEASLAEVPEGTDLSRVGLDKGILLNMTDELRGVGGGIRSLLSGDGFMGGYQSERDIERALQERSREQNGIVPELAGSLLTPAGVLSRTNLARDAAGMGALAGFGEGEGGADSLGKGVTGAALGYGGGKLVEKITPAIANSSIVQRMTQASPKAQAQQEFVEAADRQGLDYLAADLPGATKSQFATSVAKSTLGGIPLSEAATKIVEKARTARDRIAGNVGEAGDNFTAGQAAQRGVDAFEKRTGDRGAALYDAIPIDPKSTVDLSATRGALASVNGRISSNDELAALVRDPKMLAYQQALDKGDLSWEDLKAFRTFIGEKAGRPAFQQDTSKDSLDALYGALSKDIQAAATAHSPEAAKAFSRANNYWRGREARREEVLSKLVGKDRNMSPEATFQQIERWGNVKGGDYGSLARAIRSMPDDEANAVRATIIDRLGDSNPGAQNAANDAFSPDVFLTQWAKLSDRAKGVLFQGEHRKALDDLATVFDGSKFSRAFDNNSKTSIFTNVAALAGTGIVSAPAAVAMGAAQLAGGKLLASPRFARWVAALAKKPNPSAQLAHINQLTAIARSEPIIANDIFTIQERLADAFAQPSALRSAAEENDDVGNDQPTDRKRNDAQ